MTTGKGKKTFQGVIIQRALGDKGYAEFVQMYKDARLIGRREREITPLDRKIYSDYAKKGVPISEITKDTGRNRNFILTSIALVARETK
jgi:hypothetical protein